MNGTRTAVLLLPALAFLAACGGGGGGGEEGGPPAGEPDPPANRAPFVVVDFPFPDVVLVEDRIHLRGTASDPDGVARIQVRVDGVLGDPDDVEGTSTWTATARFDEGVHRIDVGAEDGLGNADPTAATIHLTRVSLLPEELGGACLDPAHDRVLVVDPVRRSLLAFRLADGAWQVLTGIDRGSGPPLQRPVAVAYAPSLDVAFVADFRSVIGVDLATGNRTVVAADPLSFAPEKGGGIELEDLASIAWDEANDRLWVALSPGTAGVVATVDPATGDRTTVSSPTQGAGPVVQNPTDLDLTPDGSTAYVTGGGPASLYAVDLATGDRAPVLRSDGAAPLPLGTPVAVHLVGETAWVLELGGSRLVEVDLPGGTFRTVADARSPDGFVFAKGADVLFDAARGEVLVVDGTPVGRARVIAIDPADGAVSRGFGFGRGGGVDLLSAADLAFDPARRRLLVADPDAQAVVAVDARTGDRTTLSRFANGPMPVPFVPGALAVDAGLDQAFVGDAVDREVLAVYLASGARELVSGPERGAGPGLDAIVDLCCDGAGAVYVAEEDANVFVRVDVLSGDRSPVGPTLHPLARVGRCEARTIADTVLAVEGDFDAGAPPWVVEIEPQTGKWTSAFDRTGLKPSDVAYEAGPDRMTLVGEGFLVTQVVGTGDYEPIGDADIGQGPLPRGACRLAIDPDRRLLYVLRVEDRRLFVVDLVSLDRIYLSR